MNIENKIIEKPYVARQTFDVLSDSIARIRNGYLAKLQYINLINTKLIRAVLKVLMENGMLLSFKENIDINGKSYLSVELFYSDRKTPALKKIQVESTPSRAIYIKKSDIREIYKKRCQSGFGCAIISTSQGVMSGHEATCKGIGGKLLITCF